MLVQEQGVPVRAAIGIAVHLPASVFPDFRKGEISYVNTLPLAGIDNERIPGALFLRAIGNAVKGGGMAVAIRLALGIIHSGNAQHVFISPTPELGNAVDFHGAGIGHQNDLGALEHQNSGAFGKFPVIANHGAHFYVALGCIQVSYIEIIPGGQLALVLRKIAGVHLGVYELLLPVAVKKAEAVTGRGEIGFQKGDANGHIKLLG